MSMKVTNMKAGKRYAVSIRRGVADGPLQDLTYRGTFLGVVGYQGTYVGHNPPERYSHVRLHRPNTKVDDYLPVGAVTGVVFLGKARRARGQA